jgi:hypothetical protein
LTSSDFDLWNKAYPPPVHADNPQPLKPTSVFLFESVMVHGSGISPSGWQWFDSPCYLAGYLLHVGIPDIAAWSFDESSFGDSGGRKPLRDTVESATQADPEDRAFFLVLADDLEKLLAGPNPVDFEAISQLLERFTERFGKTSHGDFALIAFPDAVAAGAALLERYEDLTNPLTGDDFAEPEWLDLCARAGTDPTAREVVTEVFEDAHSV